MIVDDDTQIPIENRTFDYARLKLLNPNLQTATLSQDEIKAVTAHLITNVPQLKESFEEANQPMTSELLTEIISRAQVVDIPRKTPVGSSIPLKDDILYQRGKVIFCF